MKKTIFIYVILIPFWMSVSLNAQEVSITNLKCDYQHSPIGIDNMTPCLSWEFYSPDKEHVMQESYQILVASSEDLLNEKEADVWNSGVIESGNSAQVIYDGDALQSRTKYFWIVRCWTNQSKKPLLSKTTNWEMGLLSSQDWEANWISAPHVYSFQQAAADRHRLDQASCIQQTEPSPYLRANFLVEKKIKKARLYISGLGYYETYLNGNKVGDHVLDPAWTSYHKKELYVTYDVTHQLLTGNNAWGIMLGDGWYNQHSRDVWSVDKAPWRDRPKVLAQLELEYEDGTRQAFLTGSNWKAHESPIFFSSVRQGESTGGNCRNLTFLADVDAWFYKYIFGIKCLESYPGFKQFEISPFFFEKLDWAKGSVATMYGDIIVHWQKENGKVILNMTIPANTSANVKLPEGYIIGKSKKTQTELYSGNYSLTIKLVEF